MSAIVINDRYKYAPIDALYYTAFGIYSFFHLIESTNYQTFFGMDVDAVSTVATALMLFFLLPRFVVQHYTSETLLKVAVILLTGLIVFYVTKSWICLCTGLFVCSGRRIRIEPLLWIMLFNAIAVFIIAYSGVRFGIIDTFLTSRLGEARMRDSLGFAQVNSVGFIGARICTSTVILRRDRKPWFSIAICVTLACLIEIVANSRTSEFYIIVLSLVSIILWLKRRNNTLSMIRVSKACIRLLAGFFIATVATLAFFNPGNRLEMELSRVLSDRLYSMWWFAQNYSINLFGNNQSIYTMETIWTGVSNATLTIDNAWALWIVGYGVVPTFLYLSGLFLLFRCSAKGQTNSSYQIMVLALMCSIFAFCETSALTIDSNPLIILLACVIYGDSVDTMTERV